jgi:hypothetical protein
MLIDGAQLPQPPSSSGRSLNVVWAQAPQNCDLQSPRNWGSRAPRSGSSATTAILFSPLIIGEAAQRGPAVAEGEQLPLTLQSPHHRGIRSTRPRPWWEPSSLTLQSPHHRGSRSAESVVAVTWWRQVLQSPHHRGSRSTTKHCAGKKCCSFSPLIIGEAAQHPRPKSTRAWLNSSSPLIIGEAAQLGGQVNVTSISGFQPEGPSVPSSSGKPLDADRDTFICHFPSVPSSSGKPLNTRTAGSGSAR